MKKLVALIFCTILVLSIAGCSDKDKDAENSRYKTVSAEEAVKIMEENRDHVILDVRTAAEFQEGHIEGAVNLPNEDIEGADLSEYIKDKGQLVLVYCRSGRRSADAAEKLSKQGYESVIDFGGIIDWKGKIVK